jgi:hypothetical protein
MCLFCGHELGRENGIIRSTRNALHSGIHPTSRRMAALNAAIFPVIDLKF